MRKLILAFLVTTSAISYQDSYAEADKANESVLSGFKKSGFDADLVVKDRVKVPAKYNRWHNYSIDTKAKWDDKQSSESVPAKSSARPMRPIVEGDEKKAAKSSKKPSKNAVPKPVAKPKAIAAEPAKQLAKQPAVKPMRPIVERDQEPDPKASKLSKTKKPPISRPIIEKAPSKKADVANIKPLPKPKRKVAAAKKPVPKPEPKKAEIAAAAQPSPKEPPAPEKLVATQKEAAPKEAKVLQAEPSAQPQETTVTSNLIKQTVEDYKGKSLDEVKTASGEKFGRKATTWFSTLEDSNRLTITFNNRPKVKVDKVGDEKIKLTFAAPVDYSLPEIPERFKNSFISLERLSQDGENLELILTLAEGAEANVKYNSRKVFIDTVGIPTASKDLQAELEAEIAKAAESREHEEANKDAKEGSEKVAEAKPEDADKPTEPVVEIVETNADIKKDAVEEAKKLTTEEAKKVELENLAEVLLPGEEPGALEKPNAEEAHAEVKEPEASEVKAEDGNAEETIAEKAVRKVGKTGIAYSKNGDVETLKFYFNEPVSAAVFERYGYYWLVFDSESKYDIPKDFFESKIFNNIEKVHETKLAYKLELKKDTYAVVDKSSNNWIIEFDPSISYERSSELSLKSVDDHWQVDVRSEIGYLELEDEFTRDMLKVYTLTEPSKGFVETIDQKYFSVEESLQGVVLRYIGKEGKTEITDNSLKIYGPVFSDEDDVAFKREKKDPLFAFTNIVALDAKSFKEAARIHRKEGQYKYAKFLFDQKLFQEASLYSEALEGFDAGFMNAASLYMNSKELEAREVFSSLELPPNRDDFEFDLWRIAINHEVSLEHPEMVEKIALPEKFFIPPNLKNYPDLVKSKLLINFVESEIENNNYENAQLLLNEMDGNTAFDGKNYQKYLQAKIFDHEGRRARAREVWDRVVRTADDRKSRSRAQYAIIKQDYDMEKITFEEMIDKLDKARIIWRGDRFEYMLLTELADYFAQVGKFSESLRASREAITTLPNHPRNSAIAQQMRESFKSVMEQDFKTEEETFKALSLYYDFEEIKPPGIVGDRITLALAGKLVEFDLIPEAKKVLEDYSKKVTDEEEKAIIETRVAILSYMNKNPKEALEVLALREDKGLPNYLREERGVLEIRSLIDTGQTKKAKKLLSKVPQKQADRFKVEIAYKEKQWQEMVDAYVLITEKTDEDILRLAIAYELLGMDRELTSLRKTYGNKMAKSDLSKSFDFVTNSEAVDHTNLTASLKIEPTKKLFNEYKERLNQLGVESAKEDEGNIVTFRESEPKVAQAKSKPSGGH